ncbi:hypothetical protein MYCTH_2303031 [Thermothelomyces thermophilus ATCC 42464]|uniref:DNA-directed RNA polymerase subunit n=1 Tax=Thermothelomyces thermophilus (strain ATCC 42464 / BCRC 31852 / DSM 1799) TaxID=573729 RepID=G2Q989_THET4|nr:uncharacterized protein MYCTH_2303031 [Thermothelomyces thermophilus ATCC 42464]AEO57181.1 hypothetical protein MYCTH_2303031 [Thermothelomyces thermophilus ATCC 42464]
MSANAGESSHDAVTESSQKHEKKHKKAKSDHKKKRAREDDDAAVVEETPRKSKKTKGTDAEERAEQPASLELGSDELTKKKKKKQKAQEEDEERQNGPTVSEEPKKHRKTSGKHVKDAEQPEPEAMEVDTPETAPVEEERKSDKKRKQKKSKKHKSEEAEEMPKKDLDEADGEGKEKKKRKSKQSSTTNATTLQEATSGSAAEMPADADFPFFTQTISLYVPFFPVGFDKPLTNVAAQHLDPLLNHYSPLLRGVLLGYSNLNLSDRPAKASLTHPPTDETPALLHSIDEYAVGFGWLTFDAQLFVPSRGKWMEGVVQLQSEGHIGVVCWNKFNASIEAKRLPKGWKWVDLAKGGVKSNASPAPDQEGEPEDQSDILDGEELQVVEQIHTTGYWVDQKGKKVSGKLRFRIKNFDVGLAGDYGYLSIEGTCLDDEAERTLAAQEREAERARRAKQNPGGLLRPLSRRVPEFSMTKFGREDEEEDGGQRTVLYKGSRPGTPDD